MSRLNQMWDFNNDFKKRMEIRDSFLEDNTHQDKKIQIKSNNKKSIDNKKLEPIQEYVIDRSQSNIFQNNIFPDQNKVSSYKFILKPTSKEESIQEVNTVLSNDIKVGNNSNVPTDIDTVNSQNRYKLTDLELGDKIELSNGNIVYFIKPLSLEAIWVTDIEEDRFNVNAKGWTVYVTLGAEFNVKENIGINVVSRELWASNSVASFKRDFLKENSKFVKNKKRILYENISDDIKELDSSDKKKIDGIVTQLFKMIDSKLKKYNKSGTISEENILKFKINSIFKFSINLFEETNYHEMAKDFNAYAIEYFQTQYNTKENFFSQSDYSEYAGKVNHEIKYDPDTASFITYQAFAKLLPESKAIVNKFIELDKKYMYDDEETNPFKEDMVTGDTSVPMSGNLTDVMYNALMKWKKDGKVSNIEKVKKGGLVKMFPQFSEMLSVYNKSDAFVYDTPDTPSTGQKMIIVSDGGRIFNLSVNITQTNYWKAQDFYKLFSNSTNDNPPIL